jgi:hypothetical protein
MRLLRRADPDHGRTNTPSADGTDYLAALLTRSTTVTLIDTQPAPTQPRDRNRWPIIAIAAAAVVVLVAGVVFLTRDDSSEPQIPAATTVDPGAMTAAKEVAQGFVEAYGAFDVDRAITYLADDAEITGLIEGRTPEALRPGLAWLEAVGQQLMLDSCDQVNSSATGTTVRCTYDFHSFGSDELGWGPFRGSYFDLTVRDGKIVQVSTYVETEQFSPQMWSPFADWMDANYRADADVMYANASRNGYARYTDESIQLWAQHIDEYVQWVLTSREAYSADVSAMCATQSIRLGELTAPAEGALDQVAAWNAAFAAILNEAHRGLIALDKPPATDTSASSNFYGQLARLARIAEQSAEAAAAGDSTLLAELDADYHEIRQAMTSGPAGSGLEECLASLPS